MYYARRGDTLLRILDRLLSASECSCLFGAALSEPKQRVPCSYLIVGLHSKPSRQHSSDLVSLRYHGEWTSRGRARDLLCVA